MRDPLNRRRFVAGLSVAGLAASGVTGLHSGPAVAQREGAQREGAQREGADPVAQHHRAVIFGSNTQARTAADALGARGAPDAVAILILALRFRGDLASDFVPALRTITGDGEARDWFDWMLWQQTNPEVRPHPAYLPVKAELYSRIDPQFRRFVDPSLDYSLRVEEITWGGVRVDGIPALDHAEMVAADHGDAAYLRDDDLVFGVALNGDVRAYPRRIMDWHEMFNDTIGGIPVSCAFCTLCGAAILFDGRVADRDEPFDFGSSGLLYRSNKLMYDRQTDSLWNQFTGQPVSGALLGSDIRLDVLPIRTARWGAWRAEHPETRVLTLNTGHRRNYGSGVAYAEYWASPELMFPAAHGEDIAPKQIVFGIRAPGAAKAWTLELFDRTPVINETVGTERVVLIGDPDQQSVQAYGRDDQAFQAGAAGTLVDQTGAIWRIGEAALEGPDGARLPRRSGHLAFRFAWGGFLQADVVEAD